MAEVTLTRIDFRLVHGQVVVKWCKVAKADKIIVVDDLVAGDEMLKGIFKMAAPTGVKVIVYSVEKCLAKWSEKQFGDGKVMLMFKDVQTCFRAYQGGLPLQKLQLGNIPNAAGKHSLGNEVFASDRELAMLREIAASGVQIEIHTIPETLSISFERALSKI